MFVELIDALRCVRDHEDGWLVAAAHRQRARHLMEGTIGCPVCRAIYPVRDAVADFTAGAAIDPPPPSAAGAPPAPEDLFRAGGMLALTEVRGPVVLVGAWAALAPALAELVPATYLVVNGGPRQPLRPELSELVVHRTLPVTAAAMHAVALDANACAAGLLSHSVRVVRPGGRVVAPAGARVPAELRELARDDRHWVAERVIPAGPPVQIARATR